ncbi:NACHT C-terminal helical domain 2-containing protein [Leptolyngbya sp. AN03gr2]|uniref:NACHT C-terminal helical domain 2-containing protein n=1 Tax=unclassified Leptolyngbya TaxID=2650499 RepID=UPI003D318EFD
MARRSLQASPDGIALIRKILKRKRMSQTVLAAKVNCSRQTIWSLLNGNAIDVDYFLDICKELGLNWEEIAVPELPERETSPEIEALVQRARQQGYADLDRRCGWMRVLDMRQPIGIAAIYTDVNILERITGKTRRDLDELMRGCTAETFDRFFLGQVREQRVDGLQAVREQKQLMILGRPGAGKTTFLRRLATVCNQGEFLPERVPIFVTLKEFAETDGQPRLTDFIARSFAPALSVTDVDRLLLHGRGLVLLDGLDEVLEAQHDRVLQEIREFAQRYDQTSIMITCRIAAREYVFEQFTEVEVADFTDEQIQEFADKWFKTKEPEQVDKEGRSTIGLLFWQTLEEREPIKELGTNPLLLTLLCLEFEESSEFPSSRAELYERALNILLTKWDGQRRIKREEVYKRLPTHRKVSLLGQLAMQTFERGEYFFRVHTAEKLISRYIQNLPDAKTDPEALLVDSRAVLKSIEAQHGLLTERATDIYSFSHLTFHEHFTAKNILDITDPTAQETALKRLVTHVAEKRWREVFLIVVERMDSADYLLTLMKEEIDRILAQDEKLQQFLSWVEQKSSSVDAPYKSAAIRALYFAPNRPLHSALDRNLVRDIDLNSDGTLDRAFDDALNNALAPDRLNFILDLLSNRVPSYNLDCNLDLDRFLSRVLDIDHSLDHHLDLDRFTDLTRDSARDFARTFALACILVLVRALASDAELQQELQRLQNEHPLTNDWKDYKQWWKHNGRAWIQQLRQVMIQHRNIGHDWRFTNAQQALLQQYYNANKLLVDCLNSECYVSREVREEIEATLLLPLQSSSPTE